MIASDFFSYQKRAFLTLAKKESIRVLRIWKMTLAPPMLTTYLFCVIFGNILGERIGTIRDMDYLLFIIPGLLMNVTVSESFVNTSSSLMIDKWNRVTDTLLTSPLHEFTLLLSLIAGSISRVCLVLLGLIPMTAYLSGHGPSDLPLFIVTTLITTVIFSLFGVLSGMYATKFDELSTIPTFILTPLSFFSGVFYDVNRLPDFWRTISQFNPMVSLVKLFRASYVSNPNIDISHLLLGVGFCAVLIFAVTAGVIKRGWGLKL